MSAEEYIMGRREGLHYVVRLISVILISAIVVVPSLISTQPSTVTSTKSNQASAGYEEPVVKVDPQLKQLIDQKTSWDVKVIVLLRDRVDVNSIGRIIRPDGSLRIITTFSIIPAALVEGQINRISELESVKEIRSLYLNKAYRIVPMNDTTGSLVARSLAPSWIDAVNPMPTSIANGSGIKVAVADSGIDATHPDLFGKVIASNSFVRTIYGYTSDDLLTNDQFGHGTYVAGIIAAGTVNSEYRGVAPQAQLINSKCIDPIGRGFTAGIIKAIEYAVNMSADVINISLGGGLADPDDPLSIAADSAARSGTVVVASAGNEGPRYSTGSNPAAARLAISVGAYNTSNSIASFSSRGPTLDGRPYPDMVAPGVDITSTLAAGSSFYDYAIRLGLTGGGYISLGGTSAAAPFVSGAAALLLSATGLRSQLNRFALPPSSRVEIPMTIRIALMQTAKTLGADINTQGSGLIDIDSAYTYLLSFGARLHYPIVDVLPKTLLSPPYFIGYLGESLQLDVSVLTACKANLTVSISGNASSHISLGNTIFSDIVGLTVLEVNISIPVNAMLGRYVAQIGFQNTTTYEFLSGQNVSVGYSVGVPRGRLYFSLFHADSKFSTMSGFYEMATILRNRGYSTYEDEAPITYPKVSQYDALILADPITMFSPEEINAIQRYIDNNGSLVVLGSEYPDIVAESVNKITTKYGIQYDKTFVADYSDLVFARSIDSLINITSLYGHPITSGLTEYLYGYGSTLSISPPAAMVSSTSPQFGNLTALAACDLPNGGRIVASGSLLFATDDYITSALYPGNLKLVNNIFDWLLGKSNATIETIVSRSRVKTGESFQIGIIASNNTTGGLLNSTVSCSADNGSSIPITLKSDVIGIHYNESVEFQTEGFYKFSVDAKINPAGPNYPRTFYVEVVNEMPDILNISLAFYNNPAYQNQLPTIYRSFLPDGTPIILRHGDYVNFTIEVSGLTQPNSNVTVYLTRSPSFYMANDKPLTYVSLTAARIGATAFYWAQYKPSISNTTDVYLYWISANNEGHMSSYNAIGYVMVAAIDPQIDNASTTVNSYRLADLRTVEGNYVIPTTYLVVKTGDAISVVINGTDVEDDISNMKAYAALLDYSLYVVPGMLSSELIVSQLPFDSATHSFHGNLSIPESGFVTLQGGQPIQLSLLDSPYPFFVLIVLADSDGAYSTDYAFVVIIQSRHPLLPVEVIFAILATSVAIPMLIIFVLQKRPRKGLSESPPPIHYVTNQLTVAPIS
jgi:subtilisin family serine protease